MLGPWATKIPNAKRKVLGIMFGHFEALVLSPNRKGFRKLILARLGPCSGLYWAIFGRQGGLRGSNLNSDVKNRYVWV